MGERERAALIDADRIDYSGGDLDDVVIENVMLFRLERMSDQSFWVRCYCEGKPDVVFWLTSESKIVGSSHEIET